MRVTLTRRTGQNEAGTTLDLSDTEAQWLVHRGYAEHSTTDDDSTDDSTDEPRKATTTHTPTRRQGTSRTR